MNIGAFGVVMLIAQKEDEGYDIKNLVPKHSKLKSCPGRRQAAVQMMWRFSSPSTRQSGKEDSLRRVFLRDWCPSSRIRTQPGLAILLSSAKSAAGSEHVEHVQRPDPVGHAVRDCARVAPRQDRDHVFQARRPDPDLDVSDRKLMDVDGVNPPRGPVRRTDSIPPGSPSLPDRL
jgi:hypothetical protein